MERTRCVRMTIIRPFIVSAVLMYVTYISIVIKTMSTMLGKIYEVYSIMFWVIKRFIFSPSTSCRWACRRWWRRGSPHSRSGWTGHCRAHPPGWSALAHWADLESFSHFLTPKFCFIDLGLKKLSSRTATVWVSPVWCSSYKDHLF